MKLFIAEKPELAKAIANGLSKTYKKANGYFEAGDDIVTWAYGHILGLAEPDFYNEKYSSWKLEDLPFEIDINDFKYIAKESSKEQLKIIVDLIKQDRISTIVNAGDNDEEGQILVDEILDYAKNKKPVKRILISDLTDKGVQKSLNEIKSNDEFFGLSQSGFSRSQADWIVGLNLTRAYTTLARKNGYQGVITVGRVQTPILSLIVARDKEHESHKASYYYTLQADFINDEKSFRANLKVEDRITDEEIAKAIQNACKNREADIIKAKIEDKQSNPPLPFNLLDLQAECSKRFSYKPDKTLEITQNLREKHKLITYNRSDCSYLPENLFDEAPETLTAIKNNLNEFGSFIDKADSSIKSLAWNDKNVTAHHGIIPTSQNVNIEDLSKDEINVYKLITRNFIAQFYPKKEFKTVSIELKIDDNIFSAAASKTTNLGFTTLFEKIKDDEDTEETEDISKFNILSALPLQENSLALCKEITVSKEQTKPKPYYTMATLLKDLTSVAKYITDPETKKLLIEKDKNKKGENGGIGTPATRSNHIKNLFDRGYIVEDKKAIKSTETGRKLIEMSPKILTSPDMTALWFEQQKDIETQNLSKTKFLTAILNMVKQEIDNLKSNNKFENLGNSVSCPKCKDGFLKRIKNKEGKFFWGCSRYEDGCKAIFPDVAGKPNTSFDKYKCPKCKEGYLIRKKSDKGKYWWGCSNFSKGCKFTTFDDKGKPKK